MSTPEENIKMRAVGKRGRQAKIADRKAGKMQGREK